MTRGEANEEDFEQQWGPPSPIFRMCGNDWTYGKGFRICGSERT